MFNWVIIMSLSLG